MNEALEQLAAGIGLAEPENERLRLAFADACVARVRHLLEEPAVDQCIAVLGRFLAGTASRPQLDVARADAVRLANGHRGSASIDGCGHAAVADRGSFEPEFAWQRACRAALAGQSGQERAAAPQSFS